MHKRTLSALVALCVAFGLFQTAPATAQTAPPTFYPPTQINYTQIGGLQLNGTGSIYFTLDGSTPTSSSTLYQLYQTNISNPGATQVNAIAINGGVSSTVATAFYYIDPDIFFFPTPTSWYLNSFGPQVTGKVPMWPDLVTALNGTQSTVAKQPSIVANNPISGLPAMSFSGTTYYQVPSVAWNNAGISIFMVVDPTTLTPNAQLLNYSGSTVPQNLIGVSESATNALQFSIYNSAGTSATTVSGSSALVANKYQLIEVMQGDINTTTATIFVNGVQVGQNTAMNVVPSTTQATNFIGQYSGGGQGFKGNIAEILVFSTPLNTSQRVNVETFLSQKYSLFYPNPTAPIFSSASATFASPQQVVISAQPNSTIRYTIDGTTPGATSPIYSSPLQINYTTTVKAIAVQDGLISSTTAATYTLNSTQWPAPSTGGPALQINLTSPSLAIP